MGLDIFLGGADQHTANRAALLFTSTAVIVVYIPADREYDGNSEGILNLNNRVLFSWDLLESYWDKFKRGSVSYTGVW
jgi:hypothetical protein